MYIDEEKNKFDLSDHYMIESYFKLPYIKIRKTREIETITYLTINEVTKHRYIKRLGEEINKMSNNETGFRSPCMRPRSDPAKMKNSTQTTLPHFNFSVTAKLKDVTSRLIILIDEEINEANWMVTNSAKLNRRTKQQTQFGISASNGSRDMARTKSWRKKKNKNNEANWMVSNSAKLDRRTKPHTQFGVSASNGSRDMARTKSWQKKKK